MTIVQSHAASAPAGERLIVLLEIPDLGGGDPLRFAEGLSDETVTLEDSSVVTFPASGFEAQAAAVASSVWLLVRSRPARPRRSAMSVMRGW